MSIDQDGKRYRPVCDGCARILPAAIGVDGANEIMRLAHWREVKKAASASHYCPDCRMVKQSKRRTT